FVIQLYLHDALPIFMTYNNERIFLSSPHMSGNEQKYIQEAFDLNWIAPLGNNVNGLESELANYNAIQDAAVVVSGTAAIHLALRDRKSTRLNSSHVS